MKFSTEKKTTLCIYTEAEYDTEKMECEVRALRRELEETRTALRLQTVRCRQLVAAFTTKLQEKEAEVRAGRELRDQQLGRVLRALLVLEARLRREQRHIRQQLADRDNVIHTQQLEIARLKRDQQTGSVQSNNSTETAEESVENDENTEKESLDGSGHSSIADESATHHYDSNNWQELRKTQENHDESTSSQEDEPVRHSSATHSLGYNELKTSQSTAFVRFKKNSRNRLNNLGSYRPISRRREIVNGEKSLNKQEYSKIQAISFGEENIKFKESTLSESQDLEDSMESGCHEDEFGSRDLYKDYQHNPVLECVNQILLRDQEEMETTTYRQETVCKSDAKGTGRFNYHCHSIKEEQDEENSSEEEEESGGKQVESQLASPCSQSDHNRDILRANSDKENSVEQNKETNEPLKWPIKDKTPSPPVKAQLLEEKACLLMASQRLTLVRNLEFEELDKKEILHDNQNESPCSPQTKNGFPSGKSQVPPALPPKPPQLGAKGLYQKKMNSARLNQNHQPTSNHHHIANGSLSDQKTCSKYGSEQPQDVNQNQHDISEHKNSNDPSLKPVFRHETRTLSAPHLSEKPRQRQILSNGSLKLALNQDAAQQALSNGHDYHQEKNNNFCVTSPTFEEKLDNLNMSDFQNHSNISRHQVRGAGQISSVKNDNQVDAHTANRHNHNHEARRHKTTVQNHTSPLKGSIEELSTPPKTPPVISKKNNHCGKIRVGSSVSSLITGSSGNSIVNELTKGEAERVLVLPRVSQMVRRFEDLGTGVGRETPEDEDEEEEEDGNNALRRNFEEFKLEDVDMDSVGSGDDGGRPAGDGAEARAAVLQNGTGSGGSGNGGSYEHFLEATGLSQKSILTPSRMYSNHRNVLKPKDVKHRSRVLKAAAVNERSNNGNNGPVVKYWIEPFL